MPPGGSVCIFTPGEPLVPPGARSLTGALAARLARAADSGERVSADGALRGRGAPCPALPTVAPQPHVSAQPLSGVMVLWTLAQPELLALVLSPVIAVRWQLGWCPQKVQEAPVSRRDSCLTCVPPQPGWLA